MADVKWEEAADLIMPHVPQAEWPIVRLALITAARELHQNTLGWRELCNPIDTQRGVPDYDVLDIRNTDVLALTSLIIGTCEFETDQFIEPEEYHAKLAGRNIAQAAPEYAAYFDDLLWLFPTPNSTQPMSVTLALKPTYARAGLPKRVWARHIDAIVLGARAVLHRSPRKPYSDLVTAEEMRTAFKNEWSRISDEAESGSTPVVKRTTPFWT